MEAVKSRQQQRIRAAARRAGPSSPLYSCLWIAEPDTGQPCKESLTFHVGPDGEGVEPFDLKEEKGALFSDGSCFAGSVEVAARAGWAIIELDEQELKLVRAKYGNIRAGVP